MIRGSSVIRHAFAMFALVVGFAAGDAGAASPANAPTWSQLNPDHQQILSPLEKDWDQLSVERRKKWVGIAQRYPKMKASEQKRVQQRMIDWVKLSPQQRRAARETYRKIGKLAPAKRTDLAQRWAEYQALPEEERNSLVAPPKPAAATPRRSRTAKNPAQP